MTRRTYTRITNLCLAVGIVAVLLFDHAGSLNWLFGAVLIAAGLVAGTVHFYSQWRVPNEETAPTTSLEEDFPAELKDPRKAGEVAGWLPDSPVVAGELEYAAFTARDQGFEWGVSGSAKFRRPAWPAVRKGESAFNIGHIVELVEELSASPARSHVAEITLTPEGNLTIRFGAAGPSRSRGGLFSAFGEAKMPTASSEVN